MSIKVSRTSNKKVQLEIRQKYKKLLKLNNELKGIGQSLVKDEMDKTTDQDLFAVYALTRGYKSYCALLDLCRRGYGEEATNSSRTLFHLMIMNHVFLNHKNGKSYVEKYIHESIRYLKEMMEYMHQEKERSEVFKERLENPKPGDLSTKLVKQLETEALKLSGGKKIPMGDIPDYAELADRSSQYHTIYRQFSQIAHSTSWAMDKFFNSYREKYTSVEFGPSVKWVELSLVTGFNFYGEILAAYMTWKKIDAGKINDLIARWHVAVKELE